MPRQVDSSLLNAGVNNDPNSTISSGNVNNILASGKAGIPSLTPQFFLNGIFNLLTQIAKATGIDLTSPQAFFTSLVTMILNGGSEVLAFIEAVLQPLVDELISILGGIPIIGGVIQNLANFLGLTHTTANTGVTNAATAQYSADTANAGVAVLNAKLAGTGSSYTDTFNRAAGSGLGSDYDENLSGGSGHWTTDGLGNAVWAAGGATTQNVIDRVQATAARMVTTSQSVAAVITGGPSSTVTPGTFDSQLWLFLRMNAAKDTYVMATIDGGGQTQIGYTVGGTYTALGANGSCSFGSGDLWEFRAGVATSGVTNDYQFDLVQNGLTVLSRIDASHVSHLGIGTYDWAGIGGRAGTNVSFFTTFQMDIPTLQVVTVADRTP